MALEVILDGEARAFAPGEPIEGRVRWDDVPDRTEALELRLYYKTAGRGTEDVGIAARMGFGSPAPSDEAPFRLSAPPGPYSCDGKLISLSWAIELVALPSEKGGTPVALVIGPGAEAVALAEISPPEDDDTDGKWFSVKSNR